MGRLQDFPLVVLLSGIAALSMLLPAVHALAVDDIAVARAFVQCCALLLAVSLVVGFAAAANPPAHPARSHLLAMVFAFGGLPLLLALPFNESVADTGLGNAWWEMVSCLTTTGATLYAPDRLPPSLHLWRAQVGWMGGFFTLVMAVAVLAPLRIGGFEVFSAGTGPGAQGAAGAAAGRHSALLTERGPEAGERIVHFAGRLAPAYLAATGALWLLLILAGDRPLVALCHAMSTLSTSGITPGGGTAAAPSGFAGEVLVFAFLVLALSRRLWPGAGEVQAMGPVRRDPELRLALGLCLLVPLLLFLRHWIAALEISVEPSVGRVAASLWGGVFMVMSFLTTTGFESAGWDEARGWSGLGTPGLMLAGLAIVGGGVATTAGGVKLLRVYALLRHGEGELERILHPSSVAGGGARARRLRRDGAYISWLFFMLFAMSISGVMLAVAMTGIEFEPATILSIAALANTGPLASVAGDAPFDWATLAVSTKAVLGAAMVLGRLETLAIIALFNPDFWRA